MSRTISPAIIMRIWECGESDLFVSFLTAEKGLFKGIAMGGRKSRRRFANCLDLFCLTQLEYETRPGREVSFLHSGRLMEAFVGLRRNFSALSLAGYMVEITEILFPPGVHEPKIFELLKEAFTSLEGGMRADALRVLFEARAMVYAGFRVDLEKCLQCGRGYMGEGRAVFDPTRGRIACLRCRQESPLTPALSPMGAKTLKTIQEVPWNDLMALDLNDALIREIRAPLRLHMDYRVGQRPKSQKYL